MIQSRLVRCFRCYALIAVKFDQGAHGPLYCLDCEVPETKIRQQFEDDADGHRRALNKSAIG